MADAKFLKPLKPGDPNYDEIRAANAQAMSGFCMMADAMVRQAGLPPMAIVNALLNATVLAAHTYGMPKEELRAGFGMFAGKVDDMYANRDLVRANDPLAVSVPMGRA